MLIDEIENGLHHSILEQGFTREEKRHGKRIVRLFATTHSYECIQAAQRAFADNGEDDLTLIRLERDGEDIRPVIISEESLESRRSTSTGRFVDARVAEIGGGVRA